MVYAIGSPSSLRAFRGRSPKRLTIIIPFTVFSSLEQRSVEEGRSLSNLAAFLLEQSLHPQGLDGRSADPVRLQKRRRGSRTLPERFTFLLCQRGQVVIAASAAVIGLCQIRQTPCGPMGEAKC